MEISNLTEEQISKLGLSLKESREKRDISIAFVADTLKIRKQYLENIEKGDLNNLPSKAYAECYIKAYANFLDVDVNEYLVGLKPHTEAVKLPGRNVNVNKRSEMPSWFVVSLSFLILCLLLMYFNTYY